MIQQRTTPTVDVDQLTGVWPGVAVALRPAPEPCDVFARLCHLPRCVFFDSALRDPHLGRYSFVAADPFEVVVGAPQDSATWGRLNGLLRRYAATTLPDLPPFQGGAAGLFSYDLAQSLHHLPLPRHDEFQMPGMSVGLYDAVVAFDHATEEAWIVSQGFPATEPQQRRARAVQRAADVQRLLDRARQPAWSRPLDSSQNVSIDQLAPQFPIAGFEGLTSTFSRDDYLAAVGLVIEYIYAGDVFQVNLAQRLLHRAVTDSASLYLRLRERNPAPMAAYLNLGEYQIVSASPERFLRIDNRQVETRPIKGTRRLTGRADADRLAGEELLGSEKDRAENVMIVDLMRNDLSRVCRPESVVVSELCRLERYQFVQHLVSVVQGDLRQELGPLDLLQAAFPGGSVTGAPKLRAMEIIAQLEPTARGAYCGALGYIGFDRSMDSSILIRTITAGRGWWQFPVGGAIVADSDPAREYEETWHKAEGLLQALA